ncbi:MAG: hypothetical protein JXA54_03685 [Candidatus Heimdallarchaeota archaeon]|nr:hypothetical protein [Candidatus Heimdallarchaeota archaeon]
MEITNDQTILILKSIGNNLILGRSVENSIYISINYLEINDNIKTKFIKMLNLGSSYKEIFNELALSSKDKSLSRVWKLLAKISDLSSFETGEKILEIANNLEKNKQLMEKRDSLLKAQKYKTVFLGSMTSIFLGIISGLAPLFTSFVSIFKEIEISDITLKIVPFSLYTISVASSYFTSDIGIGKIKIKTIILSSLAYIISYFIAKAIFTVLI